MISNNIPSNLGNLVAPFLPSGQRPVGQETAENRNSTFKPVEQLAKTAETRVRQQYRQQEDQQQQKERESPHPEESDSESHVANNPPDSPSARLAQRFSSNLSPTGRHFDQLV